MRIIELESKQDEASGAKQDPGKVGGTVQEENSRAPNPIMPEEPQVTCARDMEEQKEAKARR